MLAGRSGGAVVNAGQILTALLIKNSADVSVVGFGMFFDQGIESCSAPPCEYAILNQGLVKFRLPTNLHYVIRSAIGGIF